MGTGGRNTSSLGSIKPNSLVRNSNTFGILKLVIHPTSYEWEFIPIAGSTFTDSGSANCHGAPVASGSSATFGTVASSDATPSNVDKSNESSGRSERSPARF